MSTNQTPIAIALRDYCSLIVSFCFLCTYVFEHQDVVTFFAPHYANLNYGAIERILSSLEWQKICKLFAV
jgi:hypothetical protein